MRGHQPAFLGHLGWGVPGLLRGRPRYGSVSPASLAAGDSGVQWMAKRRRGRMARVTGAAVGAQRRIEWSTRSSKRMTKRGNTSEPSERRRLLEAALTDDCEMLEPRGRFAGREAILDRISGFSDRFPGARVDITTNVDQHNGFARYGWRIVDRDGTVLLDGIDVVQRGTDGRPSAQASNPGWNARGCQMDHPCIRRTGAVLPILARGIPVWRAGLVLGGEGG